MNQLEQQLAEIEKQLKESQMDDTVAGYGWGCSDRTWELLKERTRIKKVLDNPSTL